MTIVGYPSTLKVEVGGLQVQGLAGINIDTQSKKKKKKKHKEENNDSRVPAV
jgi:hypothetical protein